jgi:hypothetical protein
VPVTNQCGWNVGISIFNSYRFEFTLGWVYWYLRAAWSVRRRDGLAGLPWTELG